MASCVEIIIFEAFWQVFDHGVTRGPFVGFRPAMGFLHEILFVIVPVEFRAVLAVGVGVRLGLGLVFGFHLRRACLRLAFGGQLF